MSPGGDGIVASHTLMPDSLYHVLSAFGEMMSPNLPLSRMQHEMIATRWSQLTRDATRLTPQDHDNYERLVLTTWRSCKLY